MSNANELYTGLATRFVDQLVHCRHLGLTVIEASAQSVLMKLPYRTELIGYPDTGVLHGGVVTTMMDTGSGCAVVCAIKHKFDEFEISPTLDLRVDYMKPAVPELPIYAFAECYRISSSIAFTRATAYQDTIDNPIANAVGSFMRLSPEMVGDEFRRALMGEQANG